MRDPRTILRTHPVTLRGLGYFPKYIVGRRTGDSRLRGNDGRATGMEDGARKMNGAAMSRTSPSNPSYSRVFLIGRE